MPRVVEEPTAVKRNVEITGETTPYRLNFDTDPNLPTIGIYAQAPTTKQSIALADAAAASLSQYVTSLENTGSVPPKSRIAIRQLGEANGAVVDGGISKAIAGMTFIGVFLVWCVLVLLAARFRETWRASATLSDSEEREAEERQTQSAQLALRFPGRRRAAHETADHRIHNGSGERGPDVAGPADLHARLRASGS